MGHHNYIVLNDQQTYATADNCYLVAILDLEGLLEIDQEYDPDQDKSFTAIIRDRKRLERLELVKVFRVGDLLSLLNIEPSEDEDDEWSGCIDDDDDDDSDLDLEARSNDD